MAVKHVMEGVHVVLMGKANAFLIDSQDGIKDPLSSRRSAASAIGPTSLQHLIITHGHVEDVWKYKR